MAADAPPGAQEPGVPDYRRMLESINAIIWHADPHTFQTTYTSGVAVQLLGYPLDAWTREPGFWLAHIHPDDRERVIDISKRAIREGRAHEIEYRMFTADGRIVWLRNLVNVVSRDGVAVDLVGVSTDITKRREAELEAVQLRQELGRVTRAAALGELSSYLAHELNQPLGAILSNAEVGLILLRQGAVPAERLAQLLEEIHRDAERGGTVINRLQALLTNRAAERQPISLRDVVTDVLELFAPVLAAQHVLVTADVPPDLPLVLADRVQMQQIVVNLLVNAVDALKRVGDTRRLMLRGRSTDACVELVVSDNGPGIPADLLPRLFQPFSTTKHGGMGIGLAMCRRIAVAHGGTVEADNPAEGGAAFTVRLPVTVATAGAVA